MTTSAPRPPVSLEHRRHGFLGFRGDGVIGRDQRGSGGEPAGIQVDQDDAGGAACAREPYVETSDGSGADDHDRVAFTHACEFLAVQHAGEGLGERRLREAQVLGMRVTPSTARTSRGTIMYSANPPGNWYPIDS